MSGFDDFVITELPKRPFTQSDGAPGQVLVRSTNTLASRELVWADMPTSSGQKIYYAAIAISGHKAFVLNEFNKIIVASSDNLFHQYVIGITTAAADANAEVQYITGDILEHNGWTFTPGMPVFLGLDGEITQTIPPTAIFSKVIGLALTPTKINVEMQPAIFFQ